MNCCVEYECFFLVSLHYSDHCKPYNMAQSFLHSLPRIDHSYRSVSNDLIMPATVHDIFAWNTKFIFISFFIPFAIPHLQYILCIDSRYQQSIQMCAYIPITISLLYILICILVLKSWCCTGRCHSRFSYGKVSSPMENSRWEHLELLFTPQTHHIQHDIQLTFRSKIIRLLMALLVVIVLFLSILYGTSFNQSVIDIANEWTLSYNDYETIIGDGQQIHSLYIPDAQTQCQQILDTPSAAPIHGNISSLTVTLSNYSDLILGFLSTADTVPNWFNSDGIKTEFVQRLRYQSK